MSAVWAGTKFYAWATGLAVRVLAQHPVIGLWNTYDLFNKETLNRFQNPIALSIQKLSAQEGSELQKGVLLALGSASTLLDTLKDMRTTIAILKDPKKYIQSNIDISNIQLQFKEITSKVFNDAFEKWKAQAKPDSDAIRKMSQAINSVFSAEEDAGNPWYKKLAANKDLTGLFVSVAAVFADNPDCMKALNVTMGCLDELLNQDILKQISASLKIIEPDMTSPPPATKSWYVLRDSEEVARAKHAVQKRKDQMSSVLDSLKPLLDENLHGLLPTVLSEMSDDDIVFLLGALRGYFMQLESITSEVRAMHQVMELVAHQGPLTHDANKEDAFEAVFLKLSSRFNQDRPDSGYDSANDGESSTDTVVLRRDLGDEQSDTDSVFMDNPSVAESETDDANPENLTRKVLSSISELYSSLQRGVTDTYPFAWVQQFFLPGLTLLSEYWDELKKQQDHLKTVESKQSLSNTQKETNINTAEIAQIKSRITALESKIKTAAGYLMQAADTPLLTLLGENPEHIVRTLMKGDYLENLGTLLRGMPKGVDAVLSKVGISSDIWETVIKPLLMPSPSPSPSPPSPTQVSPATPSSTRFPLGASQQPDKKKRSAKQAIKSFFSSVAKAPANIKKNMQYLRTAWPLVKKYLSGKADKELIFNEGVLSDLLIKLGNKRPVANTQNADGTQNPEGTSFKAVSDAASNLLIDVFSVLKGLTLKDVVTLSGKDDFVAAFLDKKPDASSPTLKESLAGFLDKLYYWIQGPLKEILSEQQQVETLAALLFRQRKDDPIACIKTLMAFKLSAFPPLETAFSEKGYLSLMPFLSDMLSEEDGKALFNLLGHVTEIAKIIKPTTVGEINSWNLFSPTVNTVIKDLQNAKKHSEESKFIQSMRQSTELFSSMADSTGLLLNLFKPPQEAVPSREDAIEKFERYKSSLASVSGLLSHRPDGIQQDSITIMQLVSPLMSDLMSEFGNILDTFRLNITMNNSPREIQFANDFLSPMLNLIVDLTKQLAELAKKPIGETDEQTALGIQQLYGYIEMIIANVGIALENPVFLKLSENLVKIIKEGLKNPPDTNKIMALMPDGLDALLKKFTTDPQLLKLIQSALTTPEPEPDAMPTLRIHAHSSTAAPSPTAAPSTTRGPSITPDPSTTRGPSITPDPSTTRNSRR